MAQGAFIGKVGCTGLCTGSHLDYRLKRNGSWVNPLVEHKKLPPGEPVPASAFAAFEATRDGALAQFISARPLTGVAMAAATVPADAAATAVVAPLR